MLKSSQIVVGVILVLVIAILGGCNMQNKSATGADPEYPAKPITVIVSFAAGGVTDIVARSMEKSAMKYLGQPLVIVNKPGGAGTIGWNEMVKVKPDGYTIGVATLGVVLQPIYGQSKYNYPTALDPIAQIANPPLVMVISPNSKFKTLNELVDYAKAHPGEIKYGHNGLGSSPQVIAEMFAHAAGIKLEQVPFQGSSETMAALLGGHIDIAFNGIPEIREYVKGDKLKVLAISGSHRVNNADFSQIPTFKEQGYNVEVGNWICIVVPKEMPSSIRSKLVEGIRNIVNDAEFQATMKQLGVEAEYLNPEECLNMWTSETQVLSKAVRETGIAEKIAAQKK